MVFRSTAPVYYVARAFCSLLLISNAAPALAAQQVPIQSDEGGLVLTGEEVLLDLVATDGKGRPILDLKPEEIEVSEAGQRQSLTSFGLVRVGPGAEASAATGSANLASGLARSPYRNFNLILIVVDRSSLRPANLKATYKAAERFVRERLSPYDLVAVFGVGRTVTLFQNFTNDKPLLLRALERLTASSENVVDQAPSPSDQVARVFSTDREGSAEVDPREASALMAARLNELAKALEGHVAEVRAQVESRAIVYGLLALTKTYANVPGRKSVVLYSEGFRVDPAVTAQFASVIGAANRNNFTFYTVDAAGLRTAPEPLPVDDQRRNTRPGQEDRTIVTGGNSALGRTESALRSDDQSSLHRLAAETGGIALRNSNDLGRGFEALEHDLRSYYALSYSPPQASADGAFRPVSVRVLRKGVEIRTRSGYVASPGGGDIVLPYEPPVLALIGGAARGSMPSSLDASVLVSYFPTKQGWRVPVTVTVNASGLDPRGDVPSEDKKAPPAKAFEVDVVALVFDKDRNIVGKLSLPSTYHVPADKVEEFRKQTVAAHEFPRTLVLPPGAYRIAVGVYDPASKRAKVVERSLALRGGPGDAVPALSSLVIGRRAEAVGDPAAGANDPFVFQGKARVVPNPDGLFVKARGDRVIAYFRLAATPNRQFMVQMTFARDGKLVVRTPATPVTTDANGDASLAPVFPLDDFAPGVYVAQILVSEGGAAVPVAMETSTFRVE
jgi:VWFA-related protein